MVYHQNLKQKQCPFCKRLGTLILHGFLYGYCNTQVRGRVKRGHRILCNKRRSHKKGCGRTYAVYRNCFTIKLWYTLESVWLFFCGIVDKTPRTTLQDLLAISGKTAYRSAKRFRYAQHTIRQLLLEQTAPPDTIASSNPLMQTVHHLKKVFPGSPNPLAAFQLFFQKALL